MKEIILIDFKMRLVEEADASFIIELRTNKELAKYLHPTPTDFNLQKKWIRDYKIREAQKSEFYFVSEKFDGERIGLTRLYNFSSDTFELGSWIFKKGVPTTYPILADLATRDFAYFQLDFKKCKFAVAKDNIKVNKYHLLFHPMLVNEDEMNYYYILDLEEYKMNKNKILKLLNYG